MKKSKGLSYFRIILKFLKISNMKKILLFAAFAVFTFISVQSQEVRFGAKAGLNLATFTGDALTGFDTRAGFHIGGLVEIPISEKFSVQPELLYSEKGSEFFSTELSLSYLDIPIMAKYHIIKGLSAELGPVASILLNAEETKRGEVKDVSDFTKKFDLGIGGGATYRLPMGVFFSLRFTKGIMNIHKDGTSENYDSDVKVQNNIFQISAGYSF